MMENRKERYWKLWGLSLCLVVVIALSVFIYQQNVLIAVGMSVSSVPIIYVIWRELPEYELEWLDE